MKVDAINKATPVTIRLPGLHLKESDYEYTSNITPYRLHPLCQMRRTLHSLLPEIWRT